MWDEAVELGYQGPTTIRSGARSVSTTSRRPGRATSAPIARARMMYQHHATYLRVARPDRVVGAQQRRLEDGSYKRARLGAKALGIYARFERRFFGGAETVRARDPGHKTGSSGNDASSAFSDGRRDPRLILDVRRRLRRSSCAVVRAAPPRRVARRPIPFIHLVRRSRTEGAVSSAAREIVAAGRSAALSRRLHGPAALGGRRGGFSRGEHSMGRRARAVLGAEGPRGLVCTSPRVPRRESRPAESVIEMRPGPSRRRPARLVTALDPNAGLAVALGPSRGARSVGASGGSAVEPGSVRWRALEPMARWSPSSLISCVDTCPQCLTQGAAPSSGRFEESAPREWFPG